MSDVWTSSRSAACPSDGQQHLLSATCTYASGLNASTTALCDGTQAAVSYRCPLLPKCTYWDAAAKEWVSSGCRTVRGSALGGDQASVTCHCTKLGTLSARVDTAVGAFTTLTLRPGQARPEQGRTFALLALLIAVYSSLIVSLLVLRLKRAAESLAYLRYVTERQCPFCV
jgi:hypothetical protein